MNAPGRPLPDPPANSSRPSEAHRTPCHIAAELWSFENIKTFVQAEVGMAIVPRITVAQELRDRALVQIPVAELNMPRRTLMIYREQGYLSQSTRELIKIVRSFNWGAKVTPLCVATTYRPVTKPDTLAAVCARPAVCRSCADP